MSYKLTGYFQGELFGSGQVQWTRQGENNERYQVRVIVDAGLYELRMTSLGRVSPQGLLPEAFEEYSKRVLASAKPSLMAAARSKPASAAWASTLLATSRLSLASTGAGAALGLLVR